MEISGLEIRETGAGCRIRVRVKPGAKQDVITAVHAGMLKMTVVAPPERGRANRAVARVLAGLLNLATSRVQVVGGLTSHDKTVECSGISAAEMRARFERMPRISSGAPRR